MGISNFKIRQPRWKDRKVLLAKHKVDEDNYIIFTETPSLPGEYYVSGNNVRQCGIRKAQTQYTRHIPDCYEVPLELLNKVK